MKVLLTALALTFTLGAAAPSGDTVNSKCPISGEPVKEGVVVETDDGAIGVCCNRCKGTVAKWSAEKKAEFVANAVARQEKGEAKQAQKAKAGEWKGAPYLLDTCAASGRPLDVKGTPTTRVIEGRELKFCCSGCADAVAEEPEKWLPKVDEKIAKRQLAIYPTDKCLVAGEELFADGEDVAETLVIKNRLFRVCCPSCAKKVKADPAKYAEKLDQMAMRAQLEDYPLDTCVVNPEGEIGEDGKKFVIAGRLIQTCCGRCESAVRKDPAEYVAKVDAAWAKARRAKAAGKGDAKARKQTERKGDGGE